MKLMCQECGFLYRHAHTCPDCQIADLKAQLAEAEKAGEKCSKMFDEVENRLADTVRGFEAAETREAEMREALETILEERCFEPESNIGEICRYALSTPSPRAESMLKVAKECLEGHNYHNIDRGDGHAPSCECGLCQAVQELKETEK